MTIIIGALFVAFWIFDVWRLNRKMKGRIKQRWPPYCS